MKMPKKFSTLFVVKPSLLGALGFPVYHHRFVLAERFARIAVQVAFVRNEGATRHVTYVKRM